MLFSYAVRWVYIESCTLFIRGGVYRVVREAMGRTPAKLAVSALIFDYVLTGPISGVSAGQYIIGLLLEIIVLAGKVKISPEVREFWKAWGSVAIACAVTIYFFRKNVIGIHESSEKAMKIMTITTIMAAIMLSWCTLTLVMRPANQINAVPIKPDLNPKKTAAPPKDLEAEFEEAKPAEPEDPTGFLKDTSLGRKLKELPAPPEHPGQI